MIKKILITGATGFIGSHLVNKLLKDGYELIIIKRSTSCTWRVANILNKVISFDCDNIDLEDIFAKNKIDCVIHLATNYIKSHKNISEVKSMINDNINFPSTLVELCIKYNVTNFINTGTFFEYKMQDKPLKETDKIEPYNFYATTKVAFSNVLKYYSKNFNLKVIDFKLFAPFGEKDNEKLIVFLIKSLIDKKKINFSGGKQSWNFTYIKDIVQAYIKALEKIETIKGYKSFNVGYNQTHNIKSVVKYLEKISGKMLNINWNTKPYTDNEIFYVNCNNDRIKKDLKWNPQFNLQSGLKKTYNYYLNKKNEKTT